MSSGTDAHHQEFVATAARAARAAGDLLRRRFGEVHAVNEHLHHDIKLQLDVDSQALITDTLTTTYPDHSVIGEEGNAGAPNGEYAWIVDPIDGTVNFFYGIPHFAVSIALHRNGTPVAGVVLDPMMDELWTVIAETGTPKLNGRPIRVSARSQLAEAVITMGFAKSPDKIEPSVARFRRVAPRVRKVRMLGSAALAMCYVATGRLDAYLEETVSLWDIAAGQLLVEAAGGRVELTPHPDHPERYAIRCWNGRIPIDSVW